MSDEQSSKPRFEPPPWEQEAFEAFRAKQSERRTDDDLDAALRALKERPAAPPVSTPAGPAPAERAEDHA